jgi:hypothetical protein
MLEKYNTTIDVIKALNPRFAKTNKNIDSTNVKEINGDKKSFNDAEIPSLLPPWLDPPKANLHPFISSPMYSSIPAFLPSNNSSMKSISNVNSNSSVSLNKVTSAAKRVLSALEKVAAGKSVNIDSYYELENLDNSEINTSSDYSFNQMSQSLQTTSNFVNYDTLSYKSSPNKDSRNGKKFDLDINTSYKRRRKDHFPNNLITNDCFTEDSLEAKSKMQLLLLMYKLKHMKKKIKKLKEMKKKEKNKRLKEIERVKKGGNSEFKRFKRDKEDENDLSDSSGGSLTSSDEGIIFIF